MSRYILIQSKSPWESGDVGHFYALARELGERGDVTFFLVQNGVMAARIGASDAGLDGILGGKVRVLADDFSLRERGIEAGSLKEGVRSGAIEEVVDLLAGGAKALWH
jgi:sulfur transfer complex TusBCD TusB component (DsrH family)